MKRVCRSLFLILLCALMLLMTACKSSPSFSHGNASGSVYTSDFLKMKVSLGSSWTLMSEADLSTANGLSDLSDKSIQSAFDKAGFFVDMMATQKNGSIINIVVEDLDKTQENKVSEDELLNLLIEDAQEQYKLLSNDLAVSEGSLFFLGKTCRTVNVSYAVGGAVPGSLYMIQVPFIQGKYAVVVTLSSIVSQSEVQSFADMFTPL